MKEKVKSESKMRAHTSKSNFLLKEVKMSEKHEKAFGRGKQDAENAGVLDSICHNFGTIFTYTKEHESYDAGWKEGMKEKK